MVHLLLSNGTEFIIKETLFSPLFGRTLLNFKDIRENNYHVETIEENGIKYLYITSYLYGQKHILEEIKCLRDGLYINITTIRSIELTMSLTWWT